MRVKEFVILLLCIFFISEGYSVSGTDNNCGNKKKKGSKSEPVKILTKEAQINIRLERIGYAQKTIQAKFSQGTISESCYVRIAALLKKDTIRYSK